MIDLQGGIPIGPRPAQQAIQVATPLNDVQLICLMAAQLLGGNAAPSANMAVDLAMRTFIETVRRAPELGRMLREAQET